MSEEYTKAQLALNAAQCQDVDIVISTALIPVSRNPLFPTLFNVRNIFQTKKGREAPILITADMVASMKPGSVIVDLAAEAGGNCELTKPGERFVTDNGVIILGYTDLPSRLPTQSSNLFGNNIVKFLGELGNKKTGWNLDLENDVLRGAIICRNGEVTWPPDPPIAMPAPVAPVSHKTPSFFYRTTSSFA